jgi:hypothetical protein
VNATRALPSKKNATNFLMMVSVMICIAIPAVTLGTLIHELGHGIVAMLLDPGAQVWVDLHGSVSASFRSEFWWQDFFYISGGIITSTVCALLVWKSVIPRLKKDNTYLRLFWIVFTMFQVILGPIYMASAFISYGDTMWMAYSIGWIFRVNGIPIDFTILFSMSGVIISLFMLVKFIKAFNGEILLALGTITGAKIEKDATRKCAITFWITTPSIIGVFGFCLNNISLTWNIYSYFNISTIYAMISLVTAATLLLIAWYFNKRFVQTRVPSWYGKNRVAFALGILCLVTVGYVDPVDISRSDAGYSSTSYGEFGQTILINEGSMFKFYKFTNSSQPPDGLWIEDFLVQKFDFDLLRWSNPFVLFRAYDMDSIIRSYDLCVDNNDRLWLFYLKYPSQYEGPLANFSLIVESWNLTTGFDGSYHVPTTSINKTLPGFAINRNFSLRVKFDGTRDNIWMFFKLNSSSYHQTAFNVTDKTWTVPSMVNSTYGSIIWQEHGCGYYPSSMMDVSPLLSKPDGSVDLFYCNESLTKVTTLPGPDFMQSWSEPMVVSPFGYLRFLEDRIVRMFYDDRDTWIQVYDMAWNPLAAAVRVTKDYPHEESFFTQHDGQYFILSTKTSMMSPSLACYQASDATMREWSVLRTRFS